jgi:hypothetical protein
MRGQRRSAPQEKIARRQICTQTPYKLAAHRALRFAEIAPERTYNWRWALKGHDRGESGGGAVDKVGRFDRSFLVETVQTPSFVLPSQNHPVGLKHDFGVQVWSTKKLKLAH